MKISKNNILKVKCFLLGILILLPKFLTGILEIYVVAPHGLEP